MRRSTRRSCSTAARRASGCAGTRRRATGVCCGCWRRSGSGAATARRVRPRPRGRGTMAGRRAARGQDDAGDRAALAGPDPLLDGRQRERDERSQRPRVWRVRRPRPVRDGSPAGRDERSQRPRRVRRIRPVTEPEPRDHGREAVTNEANGPSGTTDDGRESVTNEANGASGTTDNGQRTTDNGQNPGPARAAPLLRRNRRGLRGLGGHVSVRIPHRRGTPGTQSRQISERVKEFMRTADVSSIVGLVRPLVRCPLPRISGLVCGG